MPLAPVTDAVGCRGSARPASVGCDRSQYPPGTPLNPPGGADLCLERGAALHGNGEHGRGEAVPERTHRSSSGRSSCFICRGGQAAFELPLRGIVHDIGTHGVQFPPIADDPFVEASLPERSGVRGRSSPDALIFMHGEGLVAADQLAECQSTSVRRRIEQHVGSERVGYPTQKPEALLERIIGVSSMEGDIVLDCVCGSGTTPVAAEKCGRRWIAADLGRFAIHTTRKRLLSIPNVRPFVVQNLGKYERQAWQVSEFGEGAELRYRRFIIELYRAQPLSGYVWLHGIRGGTFIHVGSVDAPVTVGDVRQIVLEHRRAIGTGAGAPTTSRIDLLGWDFAFELNEVAKQQAALANVDFHFVRIPREVLEKRAVEQGDIAFYELAALAVEVRHKDRSVSLQLTDFVIPLDDVPEDVQRAVTHWTQWIDYWAVDWDNNDDTFHNQWQTYRTRKDPSLQKSAAHSYEEPGCYTVVVKVIDILGNDSTKTLTVEVP